MKPERCAQITTRYANLRLGVLGDFCLDRYLEIDPEREEVSIETGLPVHNVVRVRSQPGAAGTIVNNLSALGIGTVMPIGFAGDDGEGHELRCALEALPNVRLDHFLSTRGRRTFTYCKPLVMKAGEPPRELSRLDLKNWSPTPPEVEDALAEALSRCIDRVDGLIVMDQVERVGTGTITPRVLAHLEPLLARRPELLVLADSRRSLADFRGVSWKMNRRELAALPEMTYPDTLASVRRAAASWAERIGKPVFVTLADEGMVAAAADGATHHTPALPLRGPIDIVGAGDAVTANLTAALAATATLAEALELATLAASIVIHQLGTTGTASVAQLTALRQSLPAI